MSAPAAGTVSAVVFDLGGVITESPMIAFAAYEREAGLPDGLIRQLNSTDPDTNAWARFERNELDVAGFSAAFEAEAAALGHTLDASRVLAALRGEVRPAMVEAIRRLRAAGLPLGMVSNNVSPMERGGRMDDILDLFDVIVESSIEGIRKPEPEIYVRALDRLSDAVGRRIEATDCAYLDDLGINLKPARALGFSTIKVVDPAVAIAELSALVGFPLDEAA
ncbi:HAD-IA family hydrolase [Blastococcus sp. TML/M2B]|uniref:HAD-IA family hydrolase n=1 Tax=unclassified Blastococcus TaxID=2619396 RepID=UPI00190E34FE|nr:MULTISPECIES: HAD-IA family hydrolase [unclassified Blastococcus]MBN1091319.1 HAD-IA family hydrolase [Blastococcus sp. TML/M2B]MBN1095125.1 HAD-IA family hydrolase [Blastococcus sp. TML/C7B]